MADVITTDTIKQGGRQFQGVFKEMWTIIGTITDQDAILANDTVSFALSVPGVVLGDMCMGVSITNDLSDGTDQIVATAVVTAADVVTIRVQADVGAYAVDDLNGSTVKVLVGSPNW